MKIIRSVLVLAVFAAAASAADEAIERVDRAAEVLDEVMGTPEQSIPNDLISKAECAAIIPGVKKVGLGLGGKYGKGVIVCRTGNGWSGPSTVRIEGGSIGFQIGGSSTDVVLLVMNKKGAEKLLESKFTLGADAAVAGGPVGRSAQAQTDAQMHAEILSYSRSRGAFAGVSLEGATLRPVEDDNKKIYGKKVEPKEILNGSIAAPPSTAALAKALDKHGPR